MPDSEKPKPGDVVTWVDRLRILRQGRVRTVTGEDAEIVTAHSGSALVPLDQLHVREPDAPAEPDPAALAALDARIAQTLTTRTQAAVTDVYDLYRVRWPETDQDELKLRAADAVAGEARACRRILEQRAADADGLVGT